MTAPLREMELGIACKYCAHDWSVFIVLHVDGYIYIHNLGIDVLYGKGNWDKSIIAVSSCKFQSKAQRYHLKRIPTLIMARSNSRERSYRDRSSRRRPRSGSRDRSQRKRQRSPYPESSPSPVDEEHLKSQQEKEAKQHAVELEKRRKRALAWQEQRQRLERSSSQQQEEEQEADGQQEPEGWTLDDDISDEEDNNNNDGNPVPTEEENGDQLLRLMPQKVDDDAVIIKNNNTNAVDNAALKITPKKDNGNGDAMEVDEEEEIDPLDAFMARNILPEVEKKTKRQASIPASSTGKQSINGVAGVEKKRRVTIFGDSDDDDDEKEDKAAAANGDDEYIEDDEEWAAKLKAGKLSKGDRLSVIDHSTIDYPPFRRNFYIEVPELAKLTPPEVEELKLSLDGIKTRGKDVPKPIKNWNQAGLSSRVLDILKRAGFEAPLSIQSQALPVIMSGRDCISIAKTGSGKTLAFVLPMLRHIKDQRPLANGDGPIAMVLAPTRELVVQIGREIKRLAKVVNISCTCVFGGSGVANQISELKKGTEIVVCTPGRMIDILVTGTGRITNLQRVTYLVMDEADRMFDMGFEPQIMRIVNNIRPDRQTVMFSATFPRTVEIAARKVLHNPVEILVGGRSVVNKDITQIIEIRQEGERFLRLLEVLGEWYEKGKVLVFVSSQDRCDTLFRDLLRSGYPCLSLHGGKDQSDRQSTIADFKSNVCNILVATSIAARGLDVKELVLVVNYDPPNHIEDYVHRVGRTGRAGNKGTAITFIAAENDEDQYAPDLVRALKESGAPIPDDLKKMAVEFEVKRQAGTVKAHGSGFGGSGYKFDKAEDNLVKKLKKQVAKEFGGEVYSDEDEEDDAEEEEDRKKEQVGKQRLLMIKQASSQIYDGAGQKADEEDKQWDTTTGSGTAAASQQQQQQQEPNVASLPKEVQAKLKAAQLIRDKLLATAAPQQQKQQPVPPVSAMLAATHAAQALAARGDGAFPHPTTIPSVPGNVAADLLAQMGAGLDGAGAIGAAAIAGGGVQIQQQQKQRKFETELEINDFPQAARWKVTHRETLQDIAHTYKTAIVVKGRFVRPGERLPDGERKLYLHIQGTKEEAVKKAKGTLRQLIEEATEKSLRKEGPAGPGKYSVM